MDGTRIDGKTDGMAGGCAADSGADGFLFAGVFLWLARPSLGTMLGSLALVVPGLWLRGFAAGYVKKNQELTVTGPYGYTRNPLYLGSMMIAFGFAIAGGRWSIGILLSALFLAVYLPVIRSEEAFLREKFAEFDDYARRVPRLLPRMTAAYSEGAGTGAFSRGFTGITASTMLLWELEPFIWLLRSGFGCCVEVQEIPKRIRTRW